MTKVGRNEPCPCGKWEKIQTLPALYNQKWVATDIQLPDDPLKLPIKEMVFQFDNQKFGYLCFIHSASSGHLNPGTESLFEPAKQTGVGLFSFAYF